MNEAIVLLITAVLAYLVGSFPTGVLIAKRHGIHLQSVGSGNVGATNVGRALGRRWAIVVLLIDAAKGAVPVLLARGLFDEPRWPAAVAGLCAILGHVFSVFLRGKGGKGVATALGAATALSPLPALAAFGVYVALYLPTRLSSLGSLVAAPAYGAFLFVFGTAHPANVLFAVSAVVVIVARHRENIRRLRGGTELRG